jgi:adenylate cyclase
MTEGRTQRRLAAILAADVVGYSRLVRADEEGTIERLRQLKAELVDPKLVEYQGRIVKLMGDGLLAEFASVVDAVRAAHDIQQAIAQHQAGVSEASRIVFRVGINLGDVVIDGDDIQGDGVNVAARLEGLAPPGGICVSGGAYDQVRDRLDLAFTDIGEQEVKNIDRPVRAWQWQAQATISPAARAQTPPEKPSIAVLPFDNMSGDPEQEYFVDGITEDIITELSKFRWLTVIARNSTFVYKGQAVDVPQVANKLGVGYLVEGSVRKMGDRVRITAQLIDAPSNEHIWAERYDRKLHDIFDLQDEMTQTLVGMIEPELANRERERTRNRPTENMNAWELYQRGLYHRWRFVPADIKQAHEYFDQAIALDAGFAAAHAHRAWTIYVEIMMNMTKDRAGAVAAGIADARRAIDLDDRDALGYCTQGFMLNVGHEYARAAQQFGRAIELNPSFAAAHYGLGLSLFFADPDDGSAKGLDAAEMAIRLSPNDPMMWPYLNLKGMILFHSENYQAAQEIFRRASEYPNAMFWIPLGLAASSWQLGDEQGARDIIKAARADFPSLSVATLVGFVGPVAHRFNPHYFDTMRKAGLPEE